MAHTKCHPPTLVVVLLSVDCFQRLLTYCEDFSDIAWLRISTTSLLLFTRRSVPSWPLDVQFLVLAGRPDLFHFLSSLNLLLFHALNMSLFNVLVHKLSQQFVARNTVKLRLYFLFVSFFQSGRDQAEFKRGCECIVEKKTISTIGQSWPMTWRKKYFQGTRSQVQVHRKR